MAIKIGPAGPMLAAKVVQGNQFWQIFCQNQSGQIDLRGTDFGMTGLANIAIACIGVVRWRDTKW